MEAAPDGVSWAEVDVSPSLLYLSGQCCVAKNDVYTMVQIGESFCFPGLTTVLPDVTSVCAERYLQPVAYTQTRSKSQPSFS